MTDISMILTCAPTQSRERVSIYIDPAVRERLAVLLFEPEMQGVGYSAFINRACEVAETAIAEGRRAKK